MSTPSLSPPDRVNVLLVDDRPDKLMALESVLADMGPNVQTARSGAEALRCLLRDDFAVILLDVNMPQMDGFETAALIRERQRSEKTPIIFLTAVNDAETYASRGYSLGAVDYLHMPVAPEVLKAKVAVFVDLYLKSEQIRRQAEWMRTVQEREHAAKLAAAADRLDLETRRNRFFTLAVDMLAIAGFDGRFLQLNPSWERTLGFPEAEMRRGPLTRLLHPDDRDLTSSYLRGLTDGGPPARFENRHLHADGSYRWLAWTAAPFREEGLVYLFARDVTELKAAEEGRLQLVREQEARLAAQRENEVKDQFLATLSHELRAPLTPIVGWTSMLRSGRLDAAETRRGLDVIDRSVKLQAQLIEDLLDVSRIISGKLRLDLRPLDLLPVVEAGIEAVRATAAARHTRIDLAGAPEEVRVLGDAERLQQVIWNLVSNAVKFTPAGGRVEIRLDRDGDCARVTVADTGIGIGADFLPHVFERFRQAETGASRARGGLGLGLTIVRHLVESHGGHVRAESDGVGRGARFVVTLPARDRTGPPLEPATTPDPASRDDAASGVLQGLKILVVDDDPDVRELLRVLLSGHGSGVVTAESVSAALKTLERERPDAIICDIGMPGADGYAFIEAVRARRPEDGGQIPAVALTAYASRDDCARAEAAGFQVHLAKPADPPRIIRTLMTLTGRHG